MNTTRHTLYICIITFSFIFMIILAENIKSPVKNIYLYISSIFKLIGILINFPINSLKFSTATSMNKIFIKFKSTGTNQNDIKALEIYSRHIGLNIKIKPWTGRRTFFVVEAERAWISNEQPTLKKRTETGNEEGRRMASATVVGGLADFVSFVKCVGRLHFGDEISLPPIRDSRGLGFGIWDHGGVRGCVCS